MLFGETGLSLLGYKKKKREEVEKDIMNIWNKFKDTEESSAKVVVTVQVKSKQIGKKILKKLRQTKTNKKK